MKILLVLLALTISTQAKAHDRDKELKEWIEYLCEYELMEVEFCRFYKEDLDTIIRDLDTYEERFLPDVAEID